MPWFTEGGKEHQGATPTPRFRSGPWATLGSLDLQVGSVSESSTCGDGRSSFVLSIRCMEWSFMRSVCSTDGKNMNISCTAGPGEWPSVIKRHAYDQVFPSVL